MKIEKKDGFTHERIIVLPNSITENNQKDHLSRLLYVTDIGYFPNAKNHYRKRDEGSENHILVYCVAGRGTISFQDNIVPLEQNSYVVIPAYEPHEYMADAHYPWSIYWIHFNGIASTSYIDLITEIRGQQLTSQQHAAFITMFHDIYHLLEKGYSRESMIRITNKLGILLTNMRFITTGTTDYTDVTGPIDRCIHYMLNKINERVSLEELANIANTSKSHFIHRFKEQTGYAPVDYFIHLKVQKACNLLDVTNLQIIEIANQLGYEDALYFSRIFKKTMGMSPRAYRYIQKG